jgi:hypothetical protein
MLAPPPPSDLRMQLASTIAALALIATPARAHADDSKSPEAAFALSATGALISVGLLGYAAHIAPGAEADRLALGAGASLIVTPSLGQVYAGNYLTVGLGARVGGAALMVLGYHAASCGETGDCSPQLGAASLIAGAGVFIAGVLWDVATAPRAARRWNERHLTLTPTITGDRAGLAIGGAF